MYEDITDPSELRRIANDFREVLNRERTRCADLGQQLVTVRGDLEQMRDSTRRELATAIDERDTVWREARQLRGELATAEQQLEAFQVQVRDVAIRVAQDQNWCDQGLNEVLEELGLPRKSSRYRVSVTVTANKVFDIEVQAASGGDAWRMVDDWGSSTLLEHIGELPGGWEHVSHDSSTDVQEIDD